MTCPIPAFNSTGAYVDGRLPGLTPEDLTVFFSTLFISATVGVFFTCSGGRQQTVDEFLMANKRMHWLPVGISLLSSFQSALTVVGTPLEVYKYGTTQMWILIGYPLAIWISLSLFVPVLYKLRYNSVNQYLKERFNYIIALISLGYFVLSMLFYLSLVLYIPSAVFNYVTGNQGSTMYIIASVGMCCIAYFTLGGIKAVLWTDTFQYIVMFSGVLLITIWGLAKDGSSVFTDAENSGRLDFKDYHKIFNPMPKMRFSVMALAFGSAASWISLFSVTQTQVQRVWTLKSMQDIKKAYIFNSIGLPIFNFLCIINGLIIFSYYKFCDPLSPIMSRKRNITQDFQLLPIYVQDSFSDKPGIAGLITTALVAGSISTINSGINSIATCIYYDVLLCVMPHHARQSGAVISKLVGILFGLLIIVTSITLDYNPPGDALLLAFSFFDMFGGPVLGLFSLGLFTKRANALGSGIAFIAGIAVTVAVGIVTVSHARDYPTIMSFNFTEECCYNSTSFKHACCSNDLETLQNTTINGWNDTILWDIDIKKGELCYQLVVFIGFFTVMLLGFPLSIVIDKLRNRESDVPESLQSDLRQIFFFLPQSFRQRIPSLRQVEDTKYDTLAQLDDEPLIYKVIYDEDGKVLFVIKAIQSDDAEMENHFESFPDESSDSES